MAKTKTAVAKTTKPKPDTASLKGWQQIATFLGLPISAAQRWAKSGMPVIREGRRVEASPEELNRWLGRETAEPLQIATTATTDLSSELKRGLSYIRKQRQGQRKRKVA